MNTTQYSSYSDDKNSDEAFKVEQLSLNSTKADLKFPVINESSKRPAFNKNRTFHAMILKNKQAKKNEKR